MKKNTEKKNKIKLSKGEIAGKVLAGLMAAMMLLSVCGTLVFYILDYISTK